MNLQQFLESKAQNAWIVEGDLEVYVRRAKHCVGDKIYYSFDVANAVLRKRPSGDYLKFILSLPDLLPDAFQIIYIENILAPGLDKMFKRLSYKKIEHSNPLCMFLKLH